VSGGTGRIWSDGCGVVTAESPGLSVIRVRGGLTYELCSCSAFGVAMTTHWHRKRTIPCVGDECPACPGSKGRGYVYLAVRNTVGGRLGRVKVLELPGSTFMELINWQSLLDGKTRASLLGVPFKLWRRSGTRSRVHVEEVGEARIVAEVPDAEILEALFRMWKLPLPPRDLENAVAVEEWERAVRRSVKSEHLYAS
jgi:hypothetical protein